ncbi:MAG: hypothetical protein QOH25_1532 [Acidobacteriota bacterium]|jgi:hypothetical protein|nr:hypothetical protein [Acidobacteriota bacterium]
MNCRNLETIITELARNQMLEARVKEDAHAHMKTCKRCAVRFADEQTLTAGLRAVAASVATMETPTRVEAALLKAFRQGTSSPFVLTNTPARPIRTPWLPWSIAAAAAILIFSVFALPRLLSDDSGGRAVQKASNAQPAPGLSPTITIPESEQDEAEIQPLNATVNPEDDVIPSVPRPVDRRRAVMQIAGLRNRPAQRANNLTPTTSANEEITTDFLPLSYSSSLSQMDGGQVVRVELPRSALQSFGLPVNAENASERVKADVLLGHDGVARAIRFVR